MVSVHHQNKKNSPDLDLNSSAGILKPNINLTNILLARFLYKIWASKIAKLCFGFGIFWRQNIGEKSTHKISMKLTPKV